VRGVHLARVHERAKRGHEQLAHVRDLRPAIALRALPAVALLVSRQPLADARVPEAVPAGEGADLVRAVERAGFQADAARERALRGVVLRRGGERRVEDVVRVVRVVRAVAVAVVVVVVVIRRLREIYDDVDRRAAAAAAAAAVLRVDARGRGAPPQPLRRGGEAAYRAARGRGHRAFPACDATAKTEHSNEERGARLVLHCASSE